MKIKGLDGKEYPWNFTKYNTGRMDCSKLHLQARILLCNLFPYDGIYEEVVLPGIKHEIVQRSLIADFYIHAPRLIIEVQGEQHYKFVNFFHISRAEYFRAKKLDSLKHQWCALNEITLVELPFNQVDNWLDIIRNR